MTLTNMSETQEKAREANGNAGADGKEGAKAGDQSDHHSPQPVQEARADDDLP